MKKGIVTIGCLLLAVVGSNAQNMTLDHCLEKGKLGYPLYKQKERLAENTVNKLKNLSAQYYPRMDMTGQMSWQNDVTHVSVENAPFSIPMASKDQYKAYVDVKQVIYDGGTTRAVRKVEFIRGEVDMQNLEVELYGLRSGIIHSYFLILMLDEQLKQTDFLIHHLNNRIDEVKAGVNAGVVLPSNADLLEVELLKLHQNRIATIEARKASVAVLSEYINEPLSDTVHLVLPLSVAVDTVLSRPEVQLFRLQRDQIEASRHMLTSSRIPKVNGFAQLGYGNPGFNMLLDSFEPFYLLGVRMTWNVWDWNHTQREKRILQSQRQILIDREEAFDKNLRMGSQDLCAKIRKLEQWLRTDQQIIDLRKRITLSTLSQWKNGTIMTSDYISDLNQESMAILSQEVHRIELQKAKADLANLLGQSPY